MIQVQKNLLEKNDNFGQKLTFMTSVASFHCSPDTYF